MKMFEPQAVSIDFLGVCGGGRENDKGGDCIFWGVRVGWKAGC